MARSFDHLISEAGAAADGASLLMQMPRPAPGQPPAKYDFSIRLLPGRIERWGRFAVWLSGQAPEAFAPIADWLRRVGAPAEALAAQAAEVAPVSQGVAVGCTEAGFEYRLYLEGRDRETQAPICQSLRWRPSGKIRPSTYRFHFAPETPAGEHPAALVPAWARDSFAALADDPWVKRVSGFWLRHEADGRLEQVYVAFILHPPARELPALMTLADGFDLPPEERAFLDDLPVRHVAVRGADVSDAEKAVTIYVSAPLDAAPASEAELQDAVSRAAREIGRGGSKLIEPLQPLPEFDSERGMMDQFYSGDLGRWRTVLGEEMHYHHGLFDLPCPEPDDAAMLVASHRAVAELYPFIAAGASVYDVGCGWGGPLGMLARERGCRALGITIARTQFRHVAAQGLPVRWGDAERTLPPGDFDCALLLESFEHMQDKLRLLRILRTFAKRLVMRVNCVDGVPPETGFGGTMPMVSSETLRRLIEDAGWQVIHWRNRRPETIPSAAVWARRLRALGPTDDFHLETLRALCVNVMECGDQWAEYSPLIEVVAQ